MKGFPNIRRLIRTENNNPQLFLCRFTAFSDSGIRENLREYLKYGPGKHRICKSELDQLYLFNKHFRIYIYQHLAGEMHFEHPPACFETLISRIYSGIRESFRETIRVIKGQHGIEADLPEHFGRL